MTLTLRQIVAYLEFSEKLDRVERANDLSITSLAVGVQSDKHKQAIEKTIKELSAL
jgi:hypothetical protein